MQTASPLPAENFAFRVDVRPEGDVVVVAPRGEIDLATVPDLARSVAEAREAGFTALRLDFRGVPFMDSTGLRLVLGLCAAQQDGLELSVVPGPPAVHRVSTITVAEHLVPFVANGWPR